MLKNKNVLRIISLIIAVLLWVYVTGEVNPETKEKISNIEVTFVNTDILADRGLAVVYDGDITVNAVVKGKRSAIKNAEKTGLKATVDVAAGSEGHNKGEVELKLPDGISLEEISKDEVDFMIEESVSEEKPLEIEFIGTADAEDVDSVPWAYNTDAETVRVVGAKSTVKKVKSVKGTITSNVVTDNSKNVDVDLVPVDNGNTEVKGVVLEKTSVKTTVQLLELKNISLKFNTQNVEKGLMVDSIKGLDSVKIVGMPGVLKDIEVLEAVVDLEGVTHKSSCEVKVKLPNNVYLYNKDKKMAVNVKMKAAE